MLSFIALNLAVFKMIAFNIMSNLLGQAALLNHYQDVVWRMQVTTGVMHFICIDLQSVMGHCLFSILTHAECIARLCQNSVLFDT